MTGFHEWALLNFYRVVARKGDTVAILNTGPPSDLTDINAYWEISFGPGYGERTQIVRTEEERPVTALRSLGIEPEDVDHVIVTPLVAYTAADLSAFPNAIYTIGRRGWVERLAPTH
jgi:hypothetical protein